MELRHLRCSLAVAEELHFACAAGRLHIYQSPLSRTIKELEELLGARLFVRTTRSTQLTRAGQLLLEHVPRIFSALEQARDSVKSAANGFHGQLRIALSDGITPARIPGLMAWTREEDTAVDVRLFEVPLAQQIKGLHDSSYDAGFTMADEPGDGIVSIAAWTDELMLAVPARHPVLAFKQVSIEDSVALSARSLRPRSLRRPCPPSGPLSAAARPKTSHHAARGDAAAISATYGSVSAVTFVTAVQYLEGQSTAYGGHLAAAMALMESPAIIMAVVFVNLLRRE